MGLPTMVWGCNVIYHGMEVAENAGFTATIHVPTDGGWSLYQYISRLARKKLSQWKRSSSDHLDIWLVVSIPPKNMSSSFGMMKFPI